MLDRAALVSEIEALRAGAAARDPSLLEQLGPQLRQVCGITEQDSPKQMKTKLRSAIEEFFHDQDELRIALLAVLGLHPEAPYEAPPDRLRWAAGRLSIGCRTAYRRVDLAINRFAHLAVAAAQTAPGTAQLGFILRSFRSDIMFTGDRPRFVQRRVITVIADELPAIPSAFAIQEPPPGYEPRFDIEVTKGGTQCYDIRRHGRTVEYWVEPDHPLQHGESLVLEVDLTFPDGRLMAPHYVLTPMTPIHASEVLVTFDPTHLPARVRRVNGVLPSEVDHWPMDNLDRLDKSGRIRASFPTMQQGWSYGIAWAWS